MFPRRTWLVGSGCLEVGAIPQLIAMVMLRGAAGVTALYVEDPYLAIFENFCGATVARIRGVPRQHDELVLVERHSTLRMPRRSSVQDGRALS